MRIERRFQHLTVFSEDTVSDALNKMNRNGRRVVFCVDSAGVLEGVVTDGDVRRWLLGQERIDLGGPVSEVANPDFVWAKSSADPAEVAALLDDRIHQVPLLDPRGRLVAVADRDRGPFRIGPREIGEDHPVFVIAEIGLNHNGDLDLGRRLVDEAAAAGADCAKFQMRDLSTLYRHAGATDDAREDLGSQYVLDLLDRFELPPEALEELFDRCRDVGLVPLCTAWDPVSVARLDAYGIDGLKVASADMTNHELLRVAARTGRPMVVSTGMSTESEISEAVGVLTAEGAAYALLHCNSTYPAPFRDVNLRYLQRLRELGSCPVGYSGHERGHHVAVAAVAMGARIVEKHLTLDRAMEGNDHRVSLLPGEFAAMVTQIREVDDSLGSTAERRPSQGELMNRVTLAKSLVAARDLRAGDVVAAADVDVKGPGRGVQPNRFDDLVGTRLRRDVAAGGFFYASDLEDSGVDPRPYRFRRPWGVPVRHHDVVHMAERARPDFVEFHLSYKDLELDPAHFLGGGLDTRYAVHSPDLFAGDHILNLASDDDAHRRRSVEELRRVIGVAEDLGRFFTGPDRPVLIVSLGGFTSDRPVAPADRAPMYDRVVAALAEVDHSGVELVAQTLPPYPWYLGGQLFCNLFVDPDDTVAFLDAAGIGLCLDVSHTKLAANHRGASFAEWVELLAPRARHLHVVDAAGVDGEGLQIGEGEVDFGVLAAQLDRLCPDAGFIPEIWQGHRNDGEGFWLALDRLERWL